MGELGVPVTAIWAAGHGERGRQGRGERPHGSSQRPREQLGRGRRREAPAVVAAGRGDAGAATARALPLRAAGDDDFLLPEKK